MLASFSGLARSFGLRRILPAALRSALLAPAFTLAATLVTTTTVIGCADENDPATWVKRLDDPARRSEAIGRLKGFFEMAMQDSKNNREDPKLKKVLDAAAEPLAKTYTAGGLDEKTRKDLIKLIADMRDPRTASAFAKAFNDFEPGKNDDDVRYAAQAMSGLAKENKLTDQVAIDALWTCFAKFQPSKAKSINLVKDLADAVLTVKHPSYAPKAIEKISIEVRDPKSPQEGLDQIQFWQATSIRLLARLKYTAAVKPLVKVILTPTKLDLRPVTNDALMKMPVEAEPVLISALTGTDPDLAKMGDAFGADKAHLAILADSLAYLSRPKGKEAILDMLGKAQNDTQRAIMAQSLTRFPTEKKVTDAYLAAYAKVTPNAPIALMNGIDGHAALLQASAQFYQPELTTWVLKEINAAKGEQADAMHLFALEAAVKLMPPAQVEEVGAAVKKFGTPLEQAKFDKAKEATDKCKQDAACYVGILDEPIPSTPDTAKFKAVKACWMAAAYGKDDTKTALLGKLEKIKDGAIRLSIVQVIDHLAPNGDEATATALEKIVAADVASGNAALISADDALSKVALMLRARALP